MNIKCLLARMIYSCNRSEICDHDARVLVSCAFLIGSLRNYDGDGYGYGNLKKQ